MKAREASPLYGLALVVALSMLWGLNWPAMKVALAELPPLTFRALMLGFGGPGLLLVVRLSGYSIRIPPGHFWNLVQVAMTLIVIWMILSIYGLRLISSGNAAILAYSMPAWTALFGVWLLGERMTVRRALGLAAGLGGIAVLVSRDLSAFGGSLAGPALMVAAAIVWSYGVVLQKSKSWAMPSAAVAGWQVTLGAIPMTALAALLESPDFTGLSDVVWASVAFNVFGIAIVAYIIWYKVIALYPVTVASVGILLTPVLGVILGAWMLGESVGWREVAALALIMAAIILVMFERAPERAPQPAVGE